MALWFKPRKKLPRDNITFNRYLQNPAGKGTAAVGRRMSIKSDLENRYGRLYNAHKSKFTHKIYNVAGRTIFHVTVPSEDTDGAVIYDVLVEFKAHDGSLQKNYRGDYVTFFSNNPGFMFIYGYVYYHSDMMIDDFAKYVGKLALTKAPDVRNPYYQRGYEKSTYYALLYLKAIGATEHTYINNKIQKTTIRDLENKLATSQQKLIQYRNAMALKKQNEKINKIKKQKPAGTKKTTYNKNTRHTRLKHSTKNSKPSRKALKHSTRRKAK